MRAASSITLWLVLLFGMGAAIADERLDGVLCQGTAAPAPESLPALFKLADALIAANCFDAAVHMLEDGERAYPRNAELQAKLRTTRSLVSEQDYFAGKEQAELAAKVSRNLLRCTRLGDMSACDEALMLKPNDAELLLGKGDALLKVGRPAEAEQVYRRARQVAPDNPRAAAQLAVAQAQRQSARTSCLQGTGDGALQACQGLLVPGSDETFAIHLRMASLYEQRNHPALALASYIAADAAKRGDPRVASGIAQIAQAQKRADTGPTPRVATVAQVTETVAARRYSNVAEPGRSH